MATKYYYADASGANDGTSESDAWTDFETALETIDAGDILYLKKSGSRVTGLASTITMKVATNTAMTIVEGYGTTPGDGISWQGDGRITMEDNNVPGNIVFKNIDITADNTFVWKNTNNIFNTHFYNCKFHNTSTTVNRPAFIVQHPCTFVNCYFDADSTSTTTGTVSILGYDHATFEGCVIRGAVGIYDAHIGGSALTVQNCIFTDGSSQAMVTGLSTDLIVSTTEAKAFTVSQSTFYGFSTDGIEIRDLPPLTDKTTITVISNNIFYGSSATNAINISDGSHTVGPMVVGNAYGGVTNSIAGGGTNFPNFDAVTLTADPFENGAALDFRLNGATDGGALCKGTAYPTTFQGITGAVERNIGAFQHTKESISVF